MEWILFTVLLIFTLAINSRLSKVERELQNFKNQNVSQIPVSPVASVNTFVPAQVPTPSIPTPSLPLTPTSASNFEDGLVRFFKEDFLVKLGSLLLLLAFGWGVSYAFTNNWIGPVGRIGLGLAAGVLLMGFGAFWLRKNLHQASIFLVLGLSTFNLTIFAARYVYDFFSPVTALGLMFVATAVITAISVQYKSQMLAFTCLIIAGIAPLLTAGEPSILGLFSYLFVFILGVIWVVAVRPAWAALTFASLLVVSLYSIPFWSNDVVEADRLIAIVSANIFAALFFASSIFSIFKQNTGMLKEHLYTGLGTALFLVSWILLVSDGLREQLLLVTWAIVTLFIAFAFLYIKQQINPFYLFASIATVFVAIATAQIFDGAALRIIFILETGMLIVLSQLIVPNMKVTRGLSYLLIGPAAIALESLTSSAWTESAFHQDSFIVLLFIATVSSVGLFLRELNKQAPVMENVYTYRALIYTGGFFLLAQLWLSVHALIEVEAIATTVVLVTYTILGLSLYIYGRSQNIKHYQYSGGAVLVVVIAQLLLVEVWNMELLQRFATFFVIGVLLISTAFYGRNTKKNPPTLPQQ